MADLANAAVLASLVVGMVSIPAASGSIDPQEDLSDPVANISTTESVPQDSSTTLGSDSFTKVIETAFSRFSTSIESGDVDGQLQTPQSELRLDKKPGSVVWTLETSRGTIRVKRNSTGVREKVITPEGTLVESRMRGSVATDFQGSNRQAVEKRATELRDLMEQKRETFMQKSDRSETRPVETGYSLGLDVAPEAPEKAIITNEADESLDLSGWEITNNNPKSFRLDSELEPGQQLHVYTAAEDDSNLENVTEDSEDVYVYGSDVTWEDGGDTATLFDSQGNEVEKHSY